MFKNPRFVSSRINSADTSRTDPSYTGLMKARLGHKDLQTAQKGEPAWGRKEKLRSFDGPSQAREFNGLSILRDLGGLWMRGFSK